METTPTPTMATPEAPATPIAAAPAAPEVATPAPTFADGGEMGSDEKIKWVAVAIFSITILAVAYKAIYYKKAINLLGADQKRVDNKLKELEQNLRTIRKDNYETLA
jgi:hypothetical protein